MDNHGKRTVDQANALYQEGVRAFRQGNQEKCRALSEESLVLSRALGYREGVATALIGLSRVALRDGDYAQVRALCEESMSIAEELNSKQLQVLPIHIIAEVTRLQGDYDRAEELYNQSLELNRELGNERMVGVEMHNKGYVALHKNNLHEAKGLFSESLKIYRKFESENGLAFCMAGLAAVAGAHGQFEKAARLFGAAEGQFERLGIILDPADKPEYDRNLAIAQTGLDKASFETARAEGHAMSMEQAVAYALEES